MEPVRFVGIIKLSTLIIQSNLQHFMCIACILALPGVLLALLPDTSNSIRLFVATILSLYRLLFPDQDIDHPYGPSHVAAELAGMAFSLAVSLTCTPLLTFSVCRACLGKSVVMTGSARGIMRSVGNLLITILCLVAAALVVGTATLLVALALVALGGGSAGVLITLAGVLAIGPGMVYLAVGLNLAGTVAILEESRGWEAMRRSMYLVEQKRGVTLGLLLLFIVCSLLLLPVLASDAGWISLSLGFVGNALLDLFSAVSRVVLYMSCRAGLQEPLDTLVAASAQFGPLDSSHAKFLDLKTASLTSHSPRT
ncbi:hypothetical protein L7F22_045087 [Adiantum nelumboides]|nr:hypothetical protein [Adiantum nelumboides]